MAAARKETFQSAAFRELFEVFKEILFTTILHLCKNRSIGGAFSCKLPKEYFSLWVFPVCTNKRAKIVT